MAKRRFGMGLGVVAAGLWASAAVAAPPETLVLQAFTLLVAQGFGGDMNENGGTHEQGVVTTFEKDGKQFLMSVYMSPDVAEGEGFWQCKCSSFEITREGMKPVASNVQITDNIGGYRNCNRPAIAGTDLGVIMTFGTDFMDPNTTSLWAGVLNESCAWEIPQMKISTSDNNDTGGPDIEYQGYDAATETHRAMASSFENNGGGRAWAYGLELYNDPVSGMLTLDRTFEQTVYTNLNIARQTMAAIDYDRTLYCGPYGDTRPPMLGVICAVVDASNGDVLNEMVIADSLPQQDIYYNDPVLAPLGFDRFMVKVNKSDGAGRKTNDKGSSVIELSVYEVTTDNQLLLKDQEKDLAIPFQTHASMCAGEAGDPLNPVKGVALIAASPTGVGQGLLHVMGWTNETGFTVGKEWVITEYGDSGEQSNMYGANPMNQGRNFINCIGDVANPGYGDPDGFMNTVKTFFVTTMSGKQPDQPKNSQMVAVSPATYDPIDETTIESGSSGSGAGDTTGSGSGEASGACAINHSRDDGNGAATLLMLGLALTALRRRREEV